MRIGICGFRRCNDDQQQWLHVAATRFKLVRFIYRLQLDDFLKLQTRLTDGILLHYTENRVRFAR